MTRAARRADERGGASTELVLLTPGLILLLLFVLFVGRFVGAQGDVVSASRDAARAASIARSPSAAREAALEAAEGSLVDAGRRCTGVTAVDVDVSEFRPGDGLPGRVTVEVDCTLRLADLAPLGLAPGSRHLRATSIEVVDRLRGVEA